MKRTSVLGMLVLSLVLALAPVASGGEVKGPPGPGGAEGETTPIDGFWTGDGAASICSFSGLNDVIDEMEPTRTQSYGTFVVLIMRAFGVSVHEAKEILEEAPSDSCNPTRFFLGNPKK